MQTIILNKENPHFSFCMFLSLSLLLSLSEVYSGVIKEGIAFKKSFLEWIPTPQYSKKEEKPQILDIFLGGGGWLGRVGDKAAGSLKYKLYPYIVSHPEWPSLELSSPSFYSYNIIVFSLSSKILNNKEITKKFSQTSVWCLREATKKVPPLLVRPLRPLGLKKVYFSSVVWLPPLS